MGRGRSRWSVRALVVATALAAMLVNPTAAHAISGGGCGPWNPIDPCISGSGNFVYADFYMNVAPDSSRCKAVLQIIRNDGAVVAAGSYNLTRTGRYGPISWNRASLPPLPPGSAIARVYVRTCTGAAHYHQDSPRLFYP